jgi:cellobiose-specific phosphotransferase system component IIA
MGLIEAIKAFPDAFRSHNELQSVREEWEGRIKVAEIAVKKAEADLKAAQEQNKPLMEKLDQSRKALTSLLLVFDGFYKQVMDADLSEDVRKEARQSLLQLSDQIVQIVRPDNSDATK